MVSFELTFELMLIKENVEDEGELWNKGISSRISINQRLLSRQEIAGC